MGDSIDYNYTIENRSGKTVQIVPYNDGLSEISNAVILQPGEILTKMYTYNPPGGAGYSMAKLFPPNSGYVGISFNNEKINLYSVFSQQCNSCVVPVSNYPIIYNENARNLFNINFNDDVTEVYTITPEDFQNATDCGGNCY